MKGFLCMALLLFHVQPASAQQLRLLAINAANSEVDWPLVESFAKKKLWSAYHVTPMSFFPTFGGLMNKTTYRERAGLVLPFSPRLFAKLWSRMGSLPKVSRKPYDSWLLCILGVREAATSIQC